jgi:XXXCH domain-containing protein
MKFEEKNRMTRKGLVKFFKGLSELVEKNELELGGEKITLTDSMDVEVEYKEKKGRAKLEVEVKWRLIGGSETLSQSEKKETSGDNGSRSVSEVKQEMKQSFNALRKTIEGGELPAIVNVEEFLEVNNAFVVLAQGGGYEKDLEAFIEVVNRLRVAVKSGNLDEAKAIVEEMRTAKKSCHKAYRWKE